IATNRPAFTIQAPGQVVHVTFADHGRAVIAAGGSVMQVVPTCDTEERRALTGHRGGACGVAFHPGGTELASVGYDRTVRVWDAASGRVLREWADLPGNATPIAYSHDGR